MSGKTEVERLEDCLLSNVPGTWVFSVAGTLLAIPFVIRGKTLRPLANLGCGGIMIDIIRGISACEREYAERQMKLLEAQNAVAAVAESE